METQNNKKSNLKSESSKTKETIFDHISNLNSKLKEKIDISNLFLLDNEIVYLLFIIKNSKEDPRDSIFWKKTKWNWNKDIQENGHLTINKSKELSQNPAFTKDISKILAPKILQDWILQRLNLNWKKYNLVFSKIQELNPTNLEKFFFNLTGLSFKKDLNSSFSIEPKKIEELFLTKNSQTLIKILNLDLKILEKYLVDSFVNFYWNKIKLIVNSLTLNGFDLNRFVFWKKADLKFYYFENDGCTFKSDLIVNLLINKLNITALKRINETNLKDFMYQEIFSHWKKLTPLLKKIEDLNLSLSNNSVFFQTNLDWESDFKDGILLKEKLSSKIDLGLSKQWKMMERVDESFLLNFIQAEILKKWNLIKLQLEKMKFYNSNFFSTSTWNKTGLNYKTDIKTDGSIAKPESINSFTVEQSSYLLKFSKTILDDYLKEELNTHWNKIRFTLNKIFVFNEEEILKQDFWIKTQINHKQDLNSNFTLQKFYIDKIPSWDKEKIKFIINLEEGFLEKFLIDLMVQHWNNIKSAVYALRNKNYDISDQHFWIFTNLNWHNDLKKDGSLKPETIKILPYKTINQILSIKKIDVELLETLLLNLNKETVDIKSSKQELKKPFLWSRLWRRLFGTGKRKTLNERLNKQLLIDSSALVSNVQSYKDFRKNNKVFSKFRKIYNSRIIDQHEIITFENKYIRPERYILEMNNVSKFYASGQKVEKIIKNINLKVERGDFLVILGPSGAGKSTILNLMSGIDSVDRGDLLIDGYNLSLLDESGLTKFRRQYVGFVFQQYNLLQNLTCLENVEIGSSLISEQKQSMDMDEIYQFLKIDKLLDKYPFQLSGGQQQRFSIARALAKNPELLFCDEPTGALDHKMSKKVMEVLFDINQKYNTTIVLVTHNPIFSKLAKTIIYVENGNIVQTNKNSNPTHPKDIDFSFQKNK